MLTLDQIICYLSAYQLRPVDYLKFKECCRFYGSRKTTTPNIPPSGVNLLFLLYSGSVIYVRSEMKKGKKEPGISTCPKDGSFSSLSQSGESKTIPPRLLLREKKNCPRPPLLCNIDGSLNESEFKKDFESYRAVCQGLSKLTPGGKSQFLTSEKGVSLFKPWGWETCWLQYIEIHSNHHEF